jgi:phage protein U
VIVGVFGPVIFSVSADMVRTFQQGTRERGSSYAIHEPIGHAPRIEPLSPELAQVRLEIVLDHDRGTAPALELVALAELMELQMPWPLILGPIPMGEYVITKINEEWRRFTAAGVLAKVAVGLHLLEDSEGLWAARATRAIGL